MASLPSHCGLNPRSKVKQFNNSYLEYWYLFNIIFAEKDLLKRVRREPKGSVAQELGRKRKLKEEMELATNKERKLEMISCEDFINEFKRQEKSGELSNEKLSKMYNILTSC